MESTALQSSVALKRNRNGHLTFMITGLDLTGVQEIERLEDTGYHLSEYAKLSFESREYNRHRLEVGKKYNIALLPNGFGRTTEVVQSMAEKFGYNSKSPAGIAPRIREVISDEQMKTKEMNLIYITALSRVAAIYNGSLVFRSSCNGAGGSIVSYFDYDGYCWNNPFNNAFAFIDPIEMVG